MFRDHRNLQDRSNMCRRSRVSPLGVPSVNGTQCPQLVSGGRGCLGAGERELHRLALERARIDDALDPLGSAGTEDLEQLLRRARPGPEPTLDRLKELQLTKSAANQAGLGEGQQLVADALDRAPTEASAEGVLRAALARLPPHVPVVPLHDLLVELDRHLGEADVEGGVRDVGVFVDARAGHAELHARLQLVAVADRVHAEPRIVPDARDVHLQDVNQPLGVALHGVLDGLAELLGREVGEHVEHIRDAQNPLEVVLEGREPSHRDPDALGGG